MSKEFLGEYKVIRKVGEGGMAEVFLAHHKDVPDHRVILKELKDPSLGKNFRKEANNLAKLNEHPNICQIYHFFNDGDKTIIVMQYIEGATLKDVIESEKKLPLGVFLKLAVDLLGIIAYAHERKIYHRDIKPGNIMVDKQGDLKVIDFGIAKDEADPEQTAAGIFSGTPLFAPPEQFNPMAKIDWPKADVYAIGTTLYLMITGKLPFQGNNWPEIAENKRLAEPPPPSKLVPDVPKELDRIILKAISRLPEDRYADAGEMLRDVVALRVENIVVPDSLEDTINIDKIAPPIEDVTADTRKPVPPGAEPSVQTKPKNKYLLPSVLTALIFSVGLFLHFSMDIFGLGESDIPSPVTSGQNQQQDGVTETDTANSGGAVLETGYIRILANPAADMYIDDALIAENVSSRTVELEPGKYSVRLVNNDAIEKSYSSNISVIAGDTDLVLHFFEFPVPPKEGKVLVSISPSGNLYLDNDLIVSKVSEYSLVAAVGTHVLKIENRSESIDSVIYDTVSLATNETVNRSYTFVEKLVFGRLKVGTLPVGASVYINGELQPEVTPFLFSLKPGKYKVRLFLEAPPIDRETTLVITAGDTLRYLARSAD